MTVIHSPLNPPIHSLYRARKEAPSRRQTLTRLGLLLLVGPLGIAAQHVEWRQWTAVSEQNKAHLPDLTPRVLNTVSDSAPMLQRCVCPQPCATPEPVCR
ncbi:hypothetical protein [Pseudomonas sp. PB106]|uniref:hypothetical protein n=1 Tax=Pseudomonas sp. PB106 TaxID=2494699 RepID=UPI0015B458DA|nr:hypothetical protein [Pseudomonas sp. PB106]